MQKVKLYAQFLKLRLASLVVFSAVIGYVVGLGSTPIDWMQVSWLILGGFLITGASNGFNQIIERDLDKLMVRTANRPLPTGQMTVNEAAWLAGIFALLGIFILAYYMNPLSGILGFLAMVLYSVVYTPLKRITPLAVFVGAIPGAIPPMLGCVAATKGFGEILPAAWILFVVQFMWQFPHFWAIAWVLDDDYRKAGFHMLPTRAGRNKGSAFQIMIYALFLIPISFFPVLFNMTGTVGGLVTLICGMVFFWQAYKLYQSCTIEAARKLMFGSFFYLPIVQLAVLIGV